MSTDRLATALHKAADAVENLRQFDKHAGARAGAQVSENVGVLRAVGLLRQMAEEAGLPGRPLAVGDVIHGFANGAFGRDHYHCVRIEAVGPDWIVARDPDRDDEGGASFTSGRQALELCQDARNNPCPNSNPCLLEDAR